MTAEEYSRLGLMSPPYVFELKSEEKELYYFGLFHVSDPASPIFAEIEAAFNKADPDIVFVEGFHIEGDKTKFNEKIKSETLEETINKMGEPRFTIKLAVDKGIEWQSPEPSDKDMINELLAKGFLKEEIFAQQVFCLLPQYSRQIKKNGFKQYVQYYIDSFKQNTNWEDFDYSYESAVKLVEQIVGHEMDVENDPNPHIYSDPIPWEETKDKQTVLNLISEASSIFRDRNIVREISEAFKTHKRLFVVYGLTHAVRQEPALRKMFEQMDK